jgi:hypothetical protein
MRFQSSSQRGAALVLALMLLSFLTILGGALLTTSTMDIWIGNNYTVNSQLLYIAEAGLEEARENLRKLPNGSLFSPADGSALVDASGREIGRYWVTLQTDLADTNGVFNIVSVGRIGSARKTVQMRVKKVTFPAVPAALTLDGPIAVFDVTDSTLFEIDGNDEAGESNTRGLGVISPADVDIVKAGISPIQQSAYTGAGGTTPDVDDVDSELAVQLKRPDALEDLVGRMLVVANDVYTPASGAAQMVGNYGDPANYRLAVVNGDCSLGPGTGFGILVVRGTLAVSGNFSWYGLILVIGQGVIHWNDQGGGEIRGSLLLANTRGAPTAADPLGPVLQSRGAVTADFRGSRGNGIQYNTAVIEAANRLFPYVPISIKEY